MNNLISRQMAVEAVADYIYKVCIALKDYMTKDESIDCAKSILQPLPSAELQRMKGWWVPITESDCSGYDPVLAGYEDPVVGYVCSVCGDGQEKEVMGESLWNFCPNCGADMR